MWDTHTHGIHSDSHVQKGWYEDYESTEEIRVQFNLTGRPITIRQMMWTTIAIVMWTTIVIALHRDPTTLLFTDKMRGKTVPNLRRRKLISITP